MIDFENLFSYLPFCLGVDPAGPQFQTQIFPRKQFRINTENASLVQILHTLLEYPGNPDILGHADYYANGGYCQPGCCTRFNNGKECSHMRAVYLLRSSMYLKAFGYKCQNKEKCFFDESHINTENTDCFGIHNKGLHGTLYLPTTKDPPYFHYKIELVEIPGYSIRTPWNGKQILGIFPYKKGITRVQVKWMEAATTVKPLPIREIALQTQ